MRNRPHPDFFENIEPLFGRGRRPPSFRPSRGTYGLIAAGFALLFLLLVVGPLVTLFTDLLWFRHVGYGDLFTRRLQYQAQLGLGGFLVALVVLTGSSLVALRMAGSTALAAIGIRRRVLTSPAGRAIVAACALVALVFGRVAAGGWETVARAFNASSFGVVDPLFGRDLGYYVFRLPAYEFAWGWAFSLVLLAALIAAGVHLGAMSLSAVPRLSRAAAAQLGILGAALMALLAGHHRLAMLGLVTAHNGVVHGAGFTDVNIRIPADWLLVGLCALLAVVMLAGALLRRPWLLAAAPVVWLVALVLAGGIAPAVVQAVAVKPAELLRERPYLQHEIDYTNSAFGLDGVVVKDFADKGQVSEPLLSANPDTVGNLRLWDYGPLRDAYAQLQAIRPYYDFNDVDIDRYHLADGYRQVEISARELNPANLPDQARTWVNTHLKYTHGYGAAATPVARVGQEGRPTFALGDIPPVGELKVDVPQIYFGELADGYVVVDSAEPEVDYQLADKEQYSRWAGTHGVPLNSLVNRAAFAARFGDLNLLLSGQVSGDSQLLLHRNIQDRLQTIAPFLRFDADPYLVVSGGRLYWIADAYTVSSGYPYSAGVQSQQYGDINYMRNSVKAVVDAYEGTVQLYAVDGKDPMLRTYSAIFPGTFRPIDEMPSDLRQHVRYPEGLFTVQSELLANYHMHDPQDFYNRGDSWTLPTETSGQGEPSVPLQPYYVLMRLPGETHAEFVLIQPYTPLNKSNMVAWIGARSDGDAYGKLINFRFPTNRRIDGPAQVESRIDQDLTISPALSLLNQHGSRVIRGNLLVIPIDDTILFVEPVYVVASSGNPIPELKKVIVADEQKVVWGDSLAEALAALTGGAVRTAPANPGTPETNQTQQELINEAGAIYDQMQADLRAGDLRKYAEDQDRLGAVLKKLKGGAPASPGPTPTPTR